MKTRYRTNPMKGNNALLIKSALDLMNKYADEGKYHLAISYRRMVYNAETFFGEFPEDAIISKEYPEASEREIRTERRNLVQSEKTKLHT